MPGRRTYHRWTRHDIGILISQYADLSVPEVFHVLDRRHSISAIYSKACHLGLKKSRARLKRMGLEHMTRFKCAKCGSLELVPRTDLERIPDFIRREDQESAEPASEALERSAGETACGDTDRTDDEPDAG